MLVENLSNSLSGFINFDMLVLIVFKKISLLIILVSLLSGCVSDQPIMSIGIFGTRYVVHDLKGNERGNIILRSTNKSLQSDLIYRAYEKEVSKYLLQNGLKTTTEENEADYVGFINYGFVSKQKDKKIVDVTIKEKNIYFETQDLELTNPEATNGYGQKRYKRVLVFKMYDLSKKNSEVLMVLDSKVDSTGTCDNLGALRIDLTTMMFKDFPGKHDQVEKITIPSFKVNSC